MTRNQMSHTYNFKQFEVAIAEIEKKYLACFSELYEKLALINLDADDD